MKKSTSFIITLLLGILIPCLLTANVFQKKNDTVTITVQGANNNPVLQYAQTELIRFLNTKQDTTHHDLAKEITQSDIQLVVDTTLPEAAFAVDTKRNDDKLTVVLTGNTASDVLYAAYTFLEKGGFLFEITGPVFPEHFDWKAVSNYYEKIIPAVKKRGIRQHINFPMDLSSWSLKDAKEYIRNLARMRFNYMTFHSYPGQWYAVKRKDTIEYAGHFFYGDVHLVPPYKPIKDIAVNKKYFCIPEIEPYFDDEAQRSKMAIEWLQNVMQEAKKTGMQVQFSFEPRNMTTDISRSVETVQAILKEYPMIDALEFITEEAGGWGPQTTRAKTEQTIVQHFGSEYLKDSVVMKPVKAKQSDLAYIYGQIGHDVQLIKYLKKNKIVPGNIDLKLGIYVVIPDYAKPAFYLARKSLPDIEVSIMPGHHSLNVKNNAGISLTTADDWNHAIIYSWIEFDGMMFLQQNGISGINDIVKQAVANTAEHRANAILYNHWRTAENKVTARYAAVSALYGAMDPVDFYRDYAEHYGIKPEDAFAKAMNDLNEADLKSMKNVGGIGFCWVGRWRKGGNIYGFNPEKLRTVRQAYEKVHTDLKSCSDSTTTAKGRNLLAFLDNRIRTTIVYLKVFEKAHDLSPLMTKKELNKKKKKEFVDISNETLALLEQYIDLYASINADRGCAGNLVSLWYGPVRAVKYLREKKGGIPTDEDIPENTAVDAPPLPVINPDRDK